ncbi:MAG: hypothetical protein NVSMB7_02690 [Chitinophagaceae bacterium]
MEPKKNQLIHGKTFIAYFPYLLLTVSGLSFYFFMGFPFENHNESYLWIPILSKVSIWDTLTRQVIHIESFRPLGMANAWLSYRVSGNIYLQQILNWLFAISSFILLLAAVKNKILFSLLSFVTCACFFSGYIYLFHLHGVFYGPFQLYVAALTCIAYRRYKLSGQWLAVTFAATVVIRLYHTFALLLFCAFLAGYLLQLKKSDSKTAFLMPGIALLFTIALAKIILHAKALQSPQTLIDGFLVSYRTAEVNKATSVVATALAALAAIPLFKSNRGKISTGIATAFLSVIFIYFHLPVLLLWIGVCSIKMIIEKKWVMAALIAAAAILPFGSGSGSPTYVVFVLMICTFVTSSDEILVIRDHPVLKKLTVFSLFLLLSSLLSLKAGWKFPLLPAIARPVLAEQEKTRQLKDIIEWKLKNKAYAAFNLTLLHGLSLPVYSNNTINRTNRPVTRQDFLNDYIDFFSNSTPNAGKTPALYITFGNERLKEKELIFLVKGEWNGPACVFR